MSNVAQDAVQSAAGDVIERALNVLQNAGPAAIAKIDLRIEELQKELDKLQAMKKMVAKLNGQRLRGPNKPKADGTASKDSDAPDESTYPPGYERLDERIIEALRKVKMPLRVGQICTAIGVT